LAVKVSRKKTGAEEAVPNQNSSNENK